MLPAPGQAALAVECRADDHELVALLEDTLEHAPTRAAVTAERAVLAALEAGCTAPIAALATPADALPATRAGHPSDSADGALSLHVFVALQDSSQRHEATGSDPVALGHEVAQELLDQQLLSRPDPAGHDADRSRIPVARGAFEPEPDL